MAEYDFSKCMYDISVSGEMLKIYPELAAYSEFQGAYEDNEVKIVVCIADYRSPFVEKIKDYKQRLTAIFAYLGMQLKGQKNTQLFDELLTYTNERIFSMCAVYLQMQNHHDFTHWWNLNVLYYSLINEMGKPRAKDANGNLEDLGRYVDRGLKIQKQSDPIKQDLKNIESELFSDSKMKMAIAKAKLKLTRTFAEMHSEDNGVQ